ncbi:uncharacterized protein LOC119520877 isoform X2 [Choloepus didactylus]|uniref:uncharacterized protein LOC119520877 isoform X2 n=1 Tax=Choloepus didactylus TaxID=27675 RepID=UPI00189FD882|nr:uncharacterized protein LOC119520877 isoform X2 [Choloepus didactylus]
MAQQRQSGGGGQLLSADQSLPRPPRLKLAPSAPSNLWSCCRQLCGAIHCRTWYERPPAVPWEWPLDCTRQTRQNSMLSCSKVGQAREDHLGGEAVPLHAPGFWAIVAPGPQPRVRAAAVAAAVLVSRPRLHRVACKAFSSPSPAGRQGSPGPLASVTSSCPGIFLEYRDWRVQVKVPAADGHEAHLGEDDFAIKTFPVLAEPHKIWIQETSAEPSED